MKLTVLGGAVGIWLAFMGTAAVANMIFGIRPVQILYLLAAMVVLLLVVTAATLVPARRATRVDPVDSLRVE
jgi:putative ABC transport system permease protein